MEEHPILSEYGPSLSGPFQDYTGLATGTMAWYINSIQQRLTLYVLLHNAHTQWYSAYRTSLKYQSDISRKLDRQVDRQNERQRKKNERQTDKSGENENRNGNTNNIAKTQKKSTEKEIISH